jgi:AcrR family transcriptional regulator
MNRRPPTTTATACRTRLLDAAVTEVVKFGYAELTVDRIVHRARASRTSFYAHFANKHAVVEAAYQSLFERYLGRLLPACEAQPTWPLKVKVGIGVTLDLAAASPVAAQFVAMDAMAVSGELLRQVLDSRDRLDRLLVAGRNETPRGVELPGVIEPALVAGIAGVVSTQLRTGEAKHLPAVAPELVELALTPYLGREKAGEVARRPRPQESG